MLKGNKGEWSEIYTLVKLLADGKLFAADENLEKMDDVFYPIIKIIREEVEKKKKGDNKKREYIIEENIKIFDGTSNQLLKEIPIREFMNNSQKLFNHIKEGKGKSFLIPEQGNFLNKIEVDKLKAKSTDKSDIKIIVHDLNTGKKPTFGFSIKSLVGKDSTLFNPGAGTNFIFKVDNPNKVKIDIKKINTETLLESKRSNKISKITRRIEEIEKLGCRLRYHSIQSQNLELNLSLIDSRLPEIISHLLFYKFYYKTSKINELTKKLNLENPMSFNLSKDHPFYEYKIKNLLTDSALGMTAESIWKGVYDATGGIIIVKQTGDVLCYHIYNRNQFQDYLFNHTKLDQASTSEDENNPGFASVNSKKKYHYGWLYEEDDEIFMKINLQIRFIK